MDIADDSDYDAWESDQDIEETGIFIKDIITDDIYDNPKTFITQCINKYNFDLSHIIHKHHINTYNGIRLVNYIRSIAQNTTNDDIIETIKSSIDDNYQIWTTDDQYLNPTIPNDGLIQYVITKCCIYDSDDEWSDLDNNEDDDDDDDEDGNDDNTTSIQQCNDDPHLIAHKASRREIALLQRRVDELEHLLHRTGISLRQYVDVDDNDNKNPLLVSNTSQQPHTQQQQQPSQQQTTKQTNVNTLTTPETSSSSDKDTQVNKIYFGSYSKRNIHEIMLKDIHRTLSYKSSIESLSLVLKDMIVLDVGCGTGILSLFAAQCGAKHVYAVDASDIIDTARIIARNNGYSDKITFIKGMIEDITLPVSTVDIIISEWMGYFLLFESMLPSVIYARNKWLRRQVHNISLYEEKEQILQTTGQGYNPIIFDHGDDQYTPYNYKFSSTSRLLPDNTTMYAAPSTTAPLRTEYVDYWKNVYGFDYSILINPRDLYPGIEVDILPSECILSPQQALITYDLMLCNTIDLSFTSSQCTFIIDNDNTLIDSFTVWFDTGFAPSSSNINHRTSEQLDYDRHHTDAITLDTSPFNKPTHWKQTIMRLIYVIMANKGDQITLQISSEPNKDNNRARDIHITYSYIPLSSSTSIIPSTSPIDHTMMAQPNTIYHQSYNLD